jgi:hypothetical protein
MWRFASRSPRLGRVAIFAAVFVAGIALIPGCRVSKQNADSYPATVQVINALQDSNGIQSSVDNKRVAKTVKFGDSTGMYGLAPGEYALSVDAIGGLDIQPRSLLREGDFDVQAGRHYSAVAFGAPGSIRVPASLAIFDELKPTQEESADLVKRGVASISVFNAAVGSGNVDVTVSSIVAFKSVPYGHRSNSLEVAAQPYEWGIAKAGSGDQTYGVPITLPIKAGGRYLLVITGNANNGDVMIRAFED